MKKLLLTILFSLAPFTVFAVRDAGVMYAQQGSDFTYSTSSPDVGHLYATSTAATSTFRGGLVVGQATATPSQVTIQGQDSSQFVNGVVKIFNNFGATIYNLFSNSGNPYLEVINDSGVKAFISSDVNLGAGYGSESNSSTTIRTNNTVRVTVAPGGNFGIATSSPGSLFAINNIANFTSATSSFYGNGLDLLNGCFSIKGTCVGGGSGAGTVNSGSFPQIAWYASDGTTVSGSSTDPVTFGSIIATSSKTSKLRSVNITGTATVSGGANFNGSTVTNGIWELNTTAGSMFSAGNGDIVANNIESDGILGVYGGGSTAVLTLESSIVGPIKATIGADTSNGLVFDTSSLGGSDKAYFKGGNVGFGTSTPGNVLSVTGNSDLGNYGYAGYFLASSTIATSTFQGNLQVASTSSITNLEDTIATSSTTNIDFGKSTKQLMRIGNGAITVTFSDYVAGSHVTLNVCNWPNSTAGTITWPNGTVLMWPGGVTPGQTTTVNNCDSYTLDATNATGTLKVWGNQTPSY